MGARSDQVGNRSARVAAFDQIFTDQHGVSARTGIRQQISGTTHTGLGDPDDVTGQPGSNPREAIPIHCQRLEIPGVDADHFGPGLQCPVGFLFGVHFDERCHTK